MTDLLSSHLQQSLVPSARMDPRSVRKNFHPPSQHPLHSSAPPSHNSPINNGSSDGDGSSKKRRTSSRGVANLTPEQLAKKRANDREAQRAIRERTKTQIESLEKTIRDLSNQQPHQELQTVLKQKHLIEAENANIKKKLNAALSLLQPLIGCQGVIGFGIRDQIFTPLMLLKRVYRLKS